MSSPSQSGLPSYRDATLLLIGHGSTVNRESRKPTMRQAARLRERGLFGEVLEAFWKEEPSIRTALAGAAHGRVFAVPLFISEGYFTQSVIPRELGLARAGGGFDRIRTVDGREVRYCGPVGTHASMTAVLHRRALELVAAHPCPGGVPAPEDLSVFIVGHGTGKSEQSRRAIEEQVLKLRAMATFHDVHGVYMEDDPRIPECHRLAGTPHVVLVPFFISDGLHSHEDIPVLLGAEPAEVRRRLEAGEPTWTNPTWQEPHWVWYGRSIGDEPHLPEVILERVAEMATAVGGVWAGG